MVDPKLTKVAVVMSYASDDKYRMKVEYKSGIKDVPKPATPKETLLAAIDELARICAVFGYAKEARYAVGDACQRVADYRATLGWKGETYRTTSGESLCGIALRQLGDEGRWGEIADLNADRFPAMFGPDYYPVGTLLKLPPLEVRG